MLVRRGRPRVGHLNFCSPGTQISQSVLKHTVNRILVLESTMKTLCAVALMSACAISLSAASCDPERSTQDLFRRQGLNLLKPARDYIRIGGLVVRKGNGPMEYIDPLDPVPAP